MTLPEISLLGPDLPRDLAAAWLWRILTLLLLRWAFATWIPGVMAHYRATYFPKTPPARHRPMVAWLLVLLTASAIHLAAADFPPPVLPCFALAAAAIIGAAVIDRRLGVIPDRLHSAGAIGALGIAVARLRDTSLAAVAVDAAAGLLVALGLFAAGWVYSKARAREALGLGDIKLLAWMGVALGADTLFVLFYASLAALAVALPVCVCQRRGLRSTLAFAPYLALGLVAHLLTIGVDRLAPLANLLGDRLP